MLDTLTPSLASALAEMDERRVFVLGLLAFTLLLFVIFSVGSMYKTRQRERTRRELFAYVAEGTISPDDAERLLRVGEEDPDLACLIGLAKGKD